MAPRMPRRLSAAFVVLALALTAALQLGVGDRTIYQERHRARRQALHEAVRDNRAPGGSWDAVGANGTSMRVGVVYLAEALHLATGASVANVYRAIDSACLFLFLALLPLYLMRWVAWPWAGVGLVAFAAAFVPTYDLHYFHPWDRIGLLSWLILLALVRQKKVWPVAVALVVAMTIKYDAAAVVGLYALVHADRRPSTWLGPLILGAVAVIGFAVLAIAFPQDGAAGRSISTMLATNARHFAEHGILHPVLIVFVVPVTLALVGSRGAPRFVTVSTWFGLALFVPFGLLANFREVRAQMPILLSIMPAALLALQRFSRRARSA